MMGRPENGDQVAMHSSIALLQERFRQLQRMKEMREERELKRRRSPTSTTATVLYEKPTKNKSIAVQSELIIPQPALANNSQFSLSLWPEQADYSRSSGWSTTTARSSSSSSSSRSNKVEQLSDSDVDTSLRL